MPIRLFDLQNDRRTVEIPMAGGVLHVTYRPNAINHRLAAAETTLRAEGDLYRLLSTSLLAAVVDWDLLGEDDQPLPVTQDVLDDLGVGVLQIINHAIARDLLPNLLTAVTSDAGSGTAGDRG